ncbi:WG containing repeat-containing protein [Paenimyroides aquimaris]|uniref:WG containing repeat-containing protein n=1 Tax=Paenimyroides marinum TaxID=1159016 RepID=A0A1H6J349_9FLAO|nr:WG repeat-containing protein [Paenimyroides aquimaris]SEH56505.1 WG containing repeat-containing protein [Paenimyroides aquimaris]
MKFTLTLLSVFLFNIVTAQTKFKVVGTEIENWRNIYSLVDEYGKTLKVLDTAKYYISMNDDTIGYFAIFGKKNSPGWSAIDVNENILFQVFNTSFGEPSPDYLIENKIRIIDNEDKIGFANEKGEIIIEPQFEIATSFYNGKAIIGKKCKKIPWGNHEDENGCHHYSITCEYQGYIDEKGTILKLGNYTFDEIKEEIDWKTYDGY